MGTISYDITNGQLPISVKLLQNGIVIDTNNHLSYGTYEFNGLVVGEYVIEFYEDEHLCETETIYPISVGDDDVPVVREPSICEIYVNTLTFVDWITLENPFDDVLTEIVFTEVPNYGHLTYGETGTIIQANDIIQFPLTQGIFYHTSDTELAAYTDILKYRLKGTVNYSNEGTITFNTTSCLGEVGDCLNGLTVETIYLRATTDQDLLLDEYAHACMNTGHICNGALYEIYGNGIYLGDSRMNNNNGTGGALTDYGTYICEDYKNTPDAISKTGVWTGDVASRYSRIELTQQQALDIANAVGGGTVIDFELLAAMDTYNEPSCRSGGAHRDITWTRITSPEGDVLYNGCPEGWFVSIDVCNPPEWHKIMTIQTSSPASTTFDPTVTGTGEFKWVIDTGEEFFGGNMSTTLDGMIHTIELWAFGVARVGAINMANDHIIGQLDLRDNAFKSLTSVIVNSNPSINSILLPDELSEEVTTFFAYGCGLTGNIDLSSINKVSNASFYLYSNPSLTSVTFASEITGTISNVLAYSCNLIGELNLTAMKRFGTSANLRFNSNPSLTKVLFATDLIEGVINVINTASCNIIGELDLSMFSQFATSSSTEIHVQTNPNLTNVKFNNNITQGRIRYVTVANTSIVNLNLSMFSEWYAGATVQIYNNSSLETILFNSNVTEGHITTLYIHSCPLIASLDLSGFGSIGTSANWRLYSNASLSLIKFANNVTGNFRYLYSYNCAAQVDIQLPETGVYSDLTSADFRFYGNALTSAQVNKILATIDNVSSAGFATRTMQIHTTNECPDSSSGGYDGLAARISLIDKGFTNFTISTGCPTETTTTTTTI